MATAPHSIATNQHTLKYLFAALKNRRRHNSFVYTHIRTQSHTIAHTQFASRPFIPDFSIEKLIHHVH